MFLRKVTKLSLPRNLTEEKARELTFMDDVPEFGKLDSVEVVPQLNKQPSK